jgi:hypothetical protein
LVFVLVWFFLFFIFFLTTVSQILKPDI